MGPETEPANLHRLKTFHSGLKLSHQERFILKNQDLTGTGDVKSRVP